MQLPSWLYLATSDENYSLSDLHPQEQAICSVYHPKRQQHFINGRVCAHAALKKLGRNIPVIGMDVFKLPLWPDATIGSITHTEGFAAAIVAPADTQISVGIDVEIASRCHERLWKRILTPEEEAWVKTHDDVLHIPYATAYFSLKESFYKYYFRHPEGARGIDFLDIHIVPEGEGFSIQGNALRASGKIQMEKEYVLSVVW